MFLSSVKTKQGSKLPKISCSVQFRQPGIERHERPACFQRAEKRHDHRHARLAENGGHRSPAIGIASEHTRDLVSCVVELRISKRRAVRL